MGLVLHHVFASNAEEITSAIAEAASWNADAMIVVDSPLFTANAARLAELAILHRLPTVGGNSFLTRDELLLSFWRRQCRLASGRRYGGSHLEGCQTRRSARSGNHPLQSDHQREDMLVLADEVIE